MPWGPAVVGTLYEVGDVTCWAAREEYGGFVDAGDSKGECRSARTFFQE